MFCPLSLLSRLDLPRLPPRSSLPSHTISFPSYSHRLYAPYDRKISVIGPYVYLASAAFPLALQGRQDWLKGLCNPDRPPHTSSRKRHPLFNIAPFPVPYSPRDRTGNTRSVSSEEGGDRRGEGEGEAVTSDRGSIDSNR